MASTVNSFLTLVKNLGANPALDSRLSDENILTFANMELDLTISPYLVKARGDVLMTSQDFVMSDASYVTVPYRAINNNIKAVFFALETSDSPVELPQMDQRDKSEFYSDSNIPAGYVMEGNQITLLPLGGISGGTLTVFYQMRPNRLVKTSQARQIQSINRSAGTVVISSSLSTITTSTPTDFCANYSPYPVLGIDATPTNVSGTTLYYSPSDIPAKLAAGDWVSLANYSPVINVPEEMISLLAQGTLARMLASIGDLEAASLAMKQYDRDESTSTGALGPRTNTPKKIGTRHSLIRRANAWRYRSY